ncbi:MAG: hypothetical protein KKG06_06980, partial [Bacteroidetes bacterium]|nr:hypothetical protein [Bacteroidota bacterium]
DMGTPESNVYQGIGEGFSVTGPTSKKRVGSERQVLNPIGNLMLQRVKIIARGEKNKVDQAFSGLVKIAPNEDWWKAAKPSLRKELIASGPSKGTMQDVVFMAYKHQDNVIMARFLEKERVRENGVMVDRWKIVERGVEFNRSNPRAYRMARALKNADMDTLGTILGISAKITRFIAKMRKVPEPHPADLTIAF